MKLNDQQEAAYLHNGACSLISTAGSGKTAVITKKTIRILKDNPDHHVILVTFTKASAIAMQRRLASMDPAASKRVTAGTFHSLAIKQLFFAGNSVKILDQYSQDRLIASLAKRFAPSFDEDDVRDFIEEVQTGHVSEKRKNPELVKVYQQYLRKLESHSVTDLSALIKASFKSMKDGGKPLWGTHVFVDEFQDIDAMQLQWLFAIIDSGKTPMIVGDDDQSIYGFRRSMGYKAFIEFEKKTGADRLMMERNYRCAKNILALGEKLINNNEERVPKKLIANKTENGTIGYRAYDDKESETYSIADFVRGNPDDWAVIARSNPKLDALVDALGAYNVPHTRIGGGSFWDLPIPGTLMAVCKHLVKESTVCLESALLFAGFPPDLLRGYVEFKKGAPRKRLNKSFMQRYSSCFTIDFKKEYAVRMDHALEKAALSLASKDVDSAVNAIAGWVQKVEEVRTPDPQKMFKKQRQIKSSADAIKRQKGSLKQRLMSLMKTNEKKTEGVKLMTAHGSKGLEFKNVWIMGVDSEAFPHSKLSISIEEERRLFFVAITRAEENLVISWAGTGSFFLKEIADEVEVS